MASTLEAPLLHGNAAGTHGGKGREEEEEEGEASEVSETTGFGEESTAPKAVGTLSPVDAAQGEEKK